MLVFLVLFARTAPLCAAPANTLQELYQSIGHCLMAAGGARGGEITFSFSLRRDGGLIGKKRVTYAKLSEDGANSSRDAAARNLWIENVGAAFDHCLPAQISDSLGGAIAGQPLAIRIKFRRPINEI